MYNASHGRIRWLAIDPCTKGFGFAVLESSTRLVDWGVARVRDKTEDSFVRRLDVLLIRYRPVVAILQSFDGVRRSARTCARLEAAAAHVVRKEIPVLVTSRAKVRQAFGPNGETKHTIATAIAERFPELRHHLPPPRKPWMSEDEQMKVFDAVALLVTVLNDQRFEGLWPRAHKGAFKC